MNTPTKAPHIEAAPGIRTANELSAILDRNDMSHSAVGIPHGSDVCRQRIQKNRVLIIVNIGIMYDMIGLNQGSGIARELLVPRA